MLKVVARDRSLWGFFGGNETVVQKNLTIDVTPPTLELIADDRYVNFGGVGAIVYKPSADTETSGVKIGSYFFPGTKGVIKDQPEHFFVLFAHAYNVAPGSKAVVVATDKAGNSREMAIVYELKDVKYRKSTIALTDGFLQNKVAPLVKGGEAQGTPKEVFIAVNKKLRKENEDRITAITAKATPQILWSGAFSQLSNSKVEANFADQRTYTYNNEAIDTAYHLGFDLSVTKRYPVEAANSGTRGVRRRPGHLWKHRDPRPRHRVVHALQPPELDRRQGRRYDQAEADPGQDRRDRPRRRRPPALRRVPARAGGAACGVVGREVDQGQHRAQARRPERRRDSQGAGARAAQGVGAQANGGPRECAFHRIL